MTDYPYITNESLAGGSDLPPAGDTVPCGFMRYTCEPQPRITYMNQRMIEMLRIPEHTDEEFDALALYQSNIFLMIPAEDRRRFAKYLNLVYSSDNPLAGEITVMRCDGTRARLFGWVIKSENAQGETEFQSVCMDMTEHDRLQREERAHACASRDAVQGRTQAGVAGAPGTDGSDQTDALRKENAELKEGIRDLAMRFRDGIAGFEISPEDGVRPLYASENAYEFFGYSKEEWLAMTERFTPLAQFVAYTDIPYEQFAEGLRIGEAAFPYYDVRTGALRQIKVVCTPRREGSTAPRYAMLYDADHMGTTGVDQPGGQLPAKTRQVVTIRTFGYFDVFVGDRPIAFRNKKAKELLALLVDRRGGYITSEEAIGFLWEDEPANGMTLSRYRKVALRLKNTLEEYGIPDIVESVGGKRRLVTERVQCDLYQYLSGEEQYASLFKGSYLSNYSWGETTLGELITDQN